MNKRLLIKQNNELFDKIKILKSQNAALSSQIAVFKAEIEDYRKKISALEEKIANIEVSSDEIIFETSEIFEEPREFEPEIEPEKQEVQLTDEFNFAADIIGNIVIKAAGFINQLTESSKENKKELINLILGRTEIAKSEILSAVSSEVTFSAKQDLINTQYNEALEYFKSVMEQ